MPSLSAKILALAVLMVLTLSPAGVAHPVAAEGTGSISGRVIHDVNGNGAADPGEPGMADRIVILDDNAGAVWTDQDGRYDFAGVASGRHTISLALLPPHVWATTFPVRSEEPVLTVAVVLEPGKRVTDLDFGVRSDVMLLSGTVWLNARYPSGPVNVQAWVGDRLCSELTYASPPEAGPPDCEAMYSIRVFSAEARPGCAAEGSSVSLTVNGVPANETVVWHRATEQRLHLTAGGCFALYQLQVSCSACTSSRLITVRAVIDGRICGESQYEVPIFVWPYRWSATLLLPVASASLREGCGVEGAIVHFTINGLPAHPGAIWLPGFQQLFTEVSIAVAPDTGAGGASSGSGSAALVASLAVAGALAVSVVVLLHRRQTRKEGHHHA